MSSFFTPLSQGHARVFFFVSLNYWGQLCGPIDTLRGFRVLEVLERLGGLQFRVTGSNVRISVAQGEAAHMCEVFGCPSHIRSIVSGAKTPEITDVRIACAI